MDRYTSVHCGRKGAEDAHNGNDREPQPDLDEHVAASATGIWSTYMMRGRGTALRGMPAIRWRVSCSRFRQFATLRRV